MSERLWNILLDSFWKIFLPGLKVTIPLTVISFSIALVIATAMAMVQFANIKGLRQIARFYIWIFRGTPLLVQLFVVFYGLPRAGILIDPFPAAVLVFSLNDGAYSAETMRAALRTAFPPLSNSLIAMVKDTSLAANITVTEMFMVTQRIVARTHEPLALYIEVGLIYLLFSTVLTKLQGIGEKKLSTYQKKGE